MRVRPPSIDSLQKKAKRYYMLLLEGKSMLEIANLEKVPEFRVRSFISWHKKTVKA